MNHSSIFNYLVTIFMLCSPITAIPIFLNLSSGKDKKERVRIALSAGFAVAFILILTTWIGESLLSFLGVRIPAFQCAGAVVVFLLALSMLNAEVSSMRHNEEDFDKKPSSIAVVPLAIPVMAGPGALSTVIVAANKYSGYENHMILSLCGLAIGIATIVLLYFALPLEKRLGKCGLNIVTRIGGLILAAIAFEIFISGLEGMGIIS